MTAPKLLDLFCCQGGAGRGYADAGFEVFGVDINPQPRYPYPFVQATEEAVYWRLRNGSVKFIGRDGTRHYLSWSDFDAVHASPPCQAFTLAQRIRGNDHVDFVAQTRTHLLDVAKPYIIENVPGAPLRDPVTLCGAMFPELRVYRHRLFESNIPLTVPEHPEHVAPLRKMGRRPEPGDFMHVVGNFSGVQQAREAMGIDWMSRDGLRESIPPAYTRFLGAQLMAAVQAREVAA